MRESGWGHREARDPFAKMNAGRSRVNGGKLIAMLRAMLDKYEGLSLVVGDRGGKSFVVGHVGGNRRDEIYMWSGERQILLKEDWIESVEEVEDKIYIRGNFIGNLMTIRPYYRHQTRGMEAAAKVGGDAGWLIEAIEGLQKSCEEDECVWVKADDWNGVARKLQWMEYNEQSGEVVLVTGRLDMLKKVALREEELHEADVNDDKIEAMASWGETVTLYVEKKTHVQPFQPGDQRMGE